MKTSTLILISLLIACACEKNPVEPVVTDLDPPLTVQQLKMIDDAPDSHVDLEDIILPNGRSVVDFLNEFDRPSFPLWEGGQQLPI